MVILFNQVDTISNEEPNGDLSNVYSLIAEIAPDGDSDSKVVEIPEDLGSVLINAIPKDKVDLVLSQIKARIDDGESTVVLKSHLDALGIVSAVKAWAENS